MRNLPFLLPGCIALLLGGPLSAQDRGPVRIILHPPAKTARALQYTLLPELREQTDGNALDFYKEAYAELKRLGFLGNEIDELRLAMRDAPGNEEVRRDARKIAKEYEKAIALIEKGALCEHIDWGHREGLKERGVNQPLPHIQELREFTRLLAFKAQLELLEGKVAESIRTIKVGLAMSRHAAESPTLVSGLVGIALTHVLTENLHGVMSHPDAPSLYWSVTNLPRPFVDLRTALEGERLSIYGTFPGMCEVALDPNAGAMSQEQLKEYARVLNELSEGDPLPALVDRYRLALDINRKHEAAKKALIASGRPREKVEQMPHLQVAMLHAFMEYEQHLDEVVKWYGFPYWQAEPHFKELQQRIGQARVRTANSPAIPLAPLLLPAIQRVMMAQVRIERRFAMLRTIEAIRLHAAQTGKLPASLHEVKVVPVPGEDPMTGKPFVYRLVSPTLATLANPVGDNLPRDVIQMQYELVLPAKGEK